MRHLPSLMLDILIHEIRMWDDEKEQIRLFMCNKTEVCVLNNVQYETQCQKFLLPINQSL
jgi:hypothetical protein